MQINVEKLIDNKSFVAYHVLCEQRSVDATVKILKYGKNFTSSRESINNKVFSEVKRRVIRYFKNHSEYPISLSIII